MSKLHISKKVGKWWDDCADGDGTLSSSKEFPVTITDGSVSAGQTYKIKQGQHEGEMYHCQTGAVKNGEAKFKLAPTALVTMDSELVTTSHALRAALLAANKKVNIEIAREDLKTLKGSNYRLCFAKKVGDSAYNVVWQAYKEYLATNEFSWTPQYQLFGSNTFQDTITVKVSTNLVNIGLGELSILDEFGDLGDPKTGGPAISLNLDNQYGLIHPGVNQLSTGITGEMVNTPIYVAANAIVKGPTSLTPKESVLVWFEQNIETSTMFSSSRSKAIEIDLTNVAEATRLYTDQNWITP